MGEGIEVSRIRNSLREKKALLMLPNKLQKNNFEDTKKKWIVKKQIEGVLQRNVYPVMGCHK